MYESHLQLDNVGRKVTEALDFSLEISRLLDRLHPPQVPVNGHHMTIAVALIMQSLEHRNSVILLLAHGLRSSAAAMIRPTFEAYYRGVWAHKVATEEQIRDIFIDAARIPKLDTILRQLRNNQETKALASYDSWKEAGDYVHSGPLQLSRWLFRGSIEPHHTESDVVDMLELSDFCGLNAAIDLHEVCGTRQPELEAKLKEHILRRATRQVVKQYFGSKDPCRSVIGELSMVLAQVAKRKAMAL